MAVLENAKHEAFARAIVSGASQRDAYRGAGFKPKTDGSADASASKLLSDPKVAARVAELKEAAADATVMSAREVLQELTKLGRSDIRNCVVQGDDTGEVVEALRDMAENHSAAIQELSVETYMTGAGDDAREVKRVRVKLHSKTAALEMLAKHHKLLVDRTSHEDPNGDPAGTAAVEQLSELELARRIAFALESATRRPAPAAEPAAAPKPKKPKSKPKTKPAAKPAPAPEGS